MVFYTCSGCGESLKKNKVEKHVYTCRGCEYLTCIDCGKDFYGDDYKNHNQCITEDQKYSAKGTEFKPNKGDVKQQKWLENIESVVSSNMNLSEKALDLITNLKNYDNIPRKRPKFLNFLKNSVRIYDAKVGEEVWEAFSAANKNETPAVTPKTEEISSNAENKGSEVDSKVKEDKLSNGKETKSVKEEKVKKRKLLDEEAQNTISVKKKKKRKSVEQSGTQAEVSVTDNKTPAKTKKKKLKKETGVETDLAKPGVEERIETDIADDSPKKKKKKRAKKGENGCGVAESKNKNGNTEDSEHADGEGEGCGGLKVIESEVTANIKLKKKKKERANNEENGCGVAESKNENGNTVVDSEQADGEGCCGLEVSSVTESEVTANIKLKKKKIKKGAKQVAEEIIKDGAKTVLVPDEQNSGENVVLHKTKRKKRKHSVEKNGSAVDDSNDAEKHNDSPKDLSNGAVVKKKKKSKHRKLNDSANLPVTNGENLAEDIPVPKKKKKKKQKSQEFDNNVPSVR